VQIYLPICSSCSSYNCITRLLFKTPTKYVAVPPREPTLSGTYTIPECEDCLVAVKGERIDSYITCHSPHATRANITVGGKDANALMFTTEGFRPTLYTATEEDHMAVVTCSVGNDDVETVLTTTKTLYVAGISNYDMFCFQKSSICKCYQPTAKIL